jgi:NADH-quinone oxidoreductase subunit E
MLTKEEKELIEKEIKKFPVKSAAGIDALKIVQDKRRWISDDVLVDIAEMLDMSPSELDNVATFYNLIFRKPVGRHVILICDSITCWIMGYNEILVHLKNKLGISLGETSVDGRFTLLPIPCLGDCDHSPAMMVDDDLYHNLAEEDVDKILDSYK